VEMASSPTSSSSSGSDVSYVITKVENIVDSENAGGGLLTGIGTRIKVVWGRGRRSLIG
jgi:hypothetical protein